MRLPVSFVSRTDFLDLPYEKIPDPDKTIAADGFDRISKYKDLVVGFFNAD
jgi:hypothetical protein